MAIALLFMLMVAAPCLVAMRNSRNIGDLDQFEPEFESEFEREYEPEFAPEELEVAVAAQVEARAREPRPRMSGADLHTAAVEAEIEALMAKDRADRAHWEALTAAARAAGLRADAAAEAAQAASRAADRAMAAADAEFDFEVEYLPENHPSLDFPRAPVTRRRAA
jgi:hypothetical protein